MGKTLFEKVWDAHVVKRLDSGLEVLYIDRHLIHEVTSPQAFEELRNRKLPLFRKEKMVATPDHNIPTENQHLAIKDALSKFQVDTLIKNCDDFKVELYGLGHPFQGIVHVIGPELGITLPGRTLVCGDSHTSTHGAFGAIAFGIGTSQVAQVMASQCLLLTRPKTMRITVDGKLQKGVSAKDIVLYIIAKLSAAGGTGYFVEYVGSVISSLSMEARMTICNMSIEMGARGGMIAPDQTTYDYVKGREFTPNGEAFDTAVSYWKTLFSDDNAQFDKEYHFDGKDIAPMLTYGTNPGMGVKITENIPVSLQEGNQDSFKKSLDYMGFKPGESLIGKKITHVFIGSCTNSRIEDLRVVAEYVKGKRKSDHVNAMIVPGSKQVEKMAKEEGLDKILEDAGFQLREPGCSACLAMNEDKVPSGAYCVSTSNRNFEGRQGPGARTLLASPLVAAVTAIEGEIVDITNYLN